MVRCSEGHKGVLCEDCLEDNFYFNKKTARCVECPTTGAAVSIVFSLLVGGILLAATFIFLLLRQPKARRVWRKIRAFIVSIGFMAKAKSVISFFQVFTAVPTGYAAEVPEEYEKLTSWMHVFTLNILNLYPSG